MESITLLTNRQGTLEKSTQSEMVRLNILKAPQALLTTTKERKEQISLETKI